MKKIAGTLKLDQAQFREMEAFSRFGAELDAATLAILDKGRKNVELLKQPQYSPMPVEKQIAIIFCGTNGLLSKVPIDKVHEFEKQFLNLLEVKHKDILEQLRQGVVNDEIKQVLKEEAEIIANA
jgi:F-type H+-transporting ATPase subunit alpha